VARSDYNIIVLPITASQSILLDKLSIDTIQWKRSRLFIPDNC